jgi:hypothetical protein
MLFLLGNVANLGLQRIYLYQNKESIKMMLAIVG